MPSAEVSSGAPRVVVVGSSNTDLVVRTGARLPAPGETVLGGDLLTAPGGKGANQAVAAARLGAEVTLVACLGRDDFGDRTVAGLAAEGVDTDYLVRDPEAPSGTALILVDDSGENLIAVSPGANARLTPEHVERAAPVVRAADVLLLQLEVPLETVDAAARIAAEAGVTVVLDPAPARQLGDELLGRVDLLT
ncbi:MAG: ribokinase, partial [Thermoanaerobaculia bacterium]